jgi:hypothetical protein
MTEKALYVVDDDFDRATAVFAQHALPGFVAGGTLRGPPA